MSAMHYSVILFFVLALIMHGCHTIWQLKKQLHILQLNSYFNRRYFRWLQKNRAVVFSSKGLEPLLSLVGMFFQGPLIVLFLFTLSYSKLFLTRPHLPEKKPLVFTPRAMRLMLANLIFLCLLDLGLVFIWWQAGDFWLMIFIGALVIYNFFLPFFLMLTNIILLPLEELIKSWYVQDARRYLRTLTNLKVVGITGSFGKTTTKYVLTEILRQRFNVLKTPGSYNTTMGVTKVIRAELKPLHNIFVVEMSAKKPGDIQEICDLVRPKYGLITAIGEQHLETFKTLENIQQTKYELIAALPKDGTAFFNLDDRHCQELAHISTGHRVGYGIDAPNLDYRVVDLTLNGFGSSFTVVRARDNAQVCFQTKLLGRQNIYNVLAAIAIASELGMELSQMVYPLRQVMAIPHRLALKRVGTGIIFIDDTFNSNPVGSNMALEVLAQISGNRKIIVTPGMVELGVKEDEYNQLLGAAIAAVCNYVILVGRKQTLALQQGLQAKQYPLKQLFIAVDFNEAKQHLEQILQAGDVVLFENDLPDNYNEC